MQTVYRKNILLPINQGRWICSYFYEYQLDMMMLISVALDENHRDKSAEKNVKKITQRWEMF